MEEPPMPTLKITVGERDRIDQRARQRLRAAQEGADLDDAQPELNFGSYAELSRLLSAKNLELLEAIFEHEPESIRETAELVGRDYKQVHRNLSELEDIGIIEVEGGGAGQAKAPRLAYDGLEIAIPFADSDSDESASIAAP
jgi:predicted transcriptional regulator